MQLLSEATRDSSVLRCAKDVLEVVPRAMWFIRRQMRAHRGGLSVPQFRSLLRVGRQPHTNLSAVAEHLGSSLPSAPRLIAGLVNKGLVARAGSQMDRRQVTLQLTPGGKAMLRMARGATQRRMEAELSSLTPRQRAQVIGAMEILRSSLMGNVV